MQLTNEQKQQLVEDGCVVLPGAVPRDKVDAALRAINNSVGQGMNVSEMAVFRSQSYCPEVKNTPVISDLFNATPLFELAESALGEGAFKPASGGQIALRFPLAPGVENFKIGPHLDGMHSPNNGVPKGEIANFTALLGVFLSDIPHEFMGNFTVWPGTHRIYEEYFREHGPQSLLNGMPAVEMPAPRQITGRAGDAVLVHYQVAHGIAPNMSPHVRYAIFFRLKHRDHDSHRFEVMTDIWHDWQVTNDE